MTFDEAENMFDPLWAATSAAVFGFGMRVPGSRSFDLDRRDRRDPNGRQYYAHYRKGIPRSMPGPGPLGSMRAASGGSWKKKSQQPPLKAHVVRVFGICDLFRGRTKRGLPSKGIFGLDILGVARPRIIVHFMEAQWEI